MFAKSKTLVAAALVAIVAANAVNVVVAQASTSRYELESQYHGNTPPR